MGLTLVPSVYGNSGGLDGLAGFIKEFAGSGGTSLPADNESAEGKH
jgi:hypothetical protein